MDKSIVSGLSRRTHWTTDDIRSRIETNKIVVFAKGDPDHPRDGFSERAFVAMKHTGRPYDVVDVTNNSSIVAALRAYAGRVTLPMVYVDGALVTSSETLQRTLDSGELEEKVNQAFNQ